MSGKARELSWSLTKARMFEECPRRYYYHYYLARIGHFADVPEEARLAAEMKNIQSLDMWAGQVVHSTIQWALEQAKGGHIPTEQEAKDEARRRLSEGWKASLNQLWRTDQGDDHPNLFHHYYRIPTSRELTDRVKHKAFTSVSNFMTSDIMKAIVATPADRWLPIEKYASFRLDGLLVYVKFDFAFKDGRQLVVYDWKTGKPNAEEGRQLTCYGMYTSSKWDTPVENVKVCAVHLQPILDVSEHAVGPECIEDLRNYMKQSFENMVRCLRDKYQNIAVMHDFVVTDNLARCGVCNYRGICEQGKSASGEIEDVPLPDEWEYE